MASKPDNKKNAAPEGTGNGTGNARHGVDTHFDDTTPPDARQLKTDGDFIVPAPSPHGFTQINNNVICDADLSDTAFRVLCYCLSKPANWRVYNADIIKRFGYSDYKFKRAMRELKSRGFVLREQERLPDGTFGDLVTYVYGVPQAHAIAANAENQPPVEKRPKQAIEPVVENQPPVKNDNLTDGRKSAGGKTAQRKIDPHSNKEFKQQPSLSNKECAHAQKMPAEKIYREETRHFKQTIKPAVLRLLRQWDEMPDITPAMVRQAIAHTDETKGAIFNPKLLRDAMQSIQRNDVVETMVATTPAGAPADENGIDAAWRKACEYLSLIKGKPFVDAHLSQASVSYENGTLNVCAPATSLEWLERVESKSRDISTAFMQYFTETNYQPVVTWQAM